MSKWDGAMYTIPSAEGRRNADGPTPTEGQYRTQRAELLAAIKTVKEGTMSDNLREALEAEVSNGPRLTAKTRSRLFESIGDVIDKYNLPVQNMGLRPDVAELGDICGDVETAVIAWLRAILAAHPDETSDGCVKSAPYYWLECKGCGEKSTKYSDFTAWADPETAIEEATCSDWVGRDGEYFCPDCQFDDSEAAS